jgi:hypothetical protein
MGFHASPDGEPPDATSALQSFKEPEDWLDSCETADLLEVFTVDRCFPKAASVSGPSSCAL